MPACLRVPNETKRKEQTLKRKQKTKRAENKERGGKGVPRAAAAGTAYGGCAPPAAPRNWAPQGQVRATLPTATCARRRAWLPNGGAACPGTASLERPTDPHPLASLVFSRSPGLASHSSAARHRQCVVAVVTRIKTWRKGHRDGEPARE